MKIKRQPQIRITLDAKLQEYLHYNSKRSSAVAKEIVHLLHEHIGFKQAEAANNTVLHEFRGWLNTRELHLDKFSLSLNRVLSEFLESRQKPS